MGTIYPILDAAVQRFIQNQHVFFVATAPLDARSHVNVSPKGLDTLRILGPTTIAYLDLTGSGVETVAHLRENGRITLMFCAFAGPPRTLRLYGKGRVVEPGDEEWGELAGQFPEHAGARSVIVVELDRLADSCGYGVPLFEFAGQRTQLPAWAGRKGAEGLTQYKRQKNRESIDGLPGLRQTGEFRSWPGRSGR